MQQPLIQAEPKSRNWLVILDYVFYLVLIVGVAAFGYYLYSYRDIITLYLPFLLQAAGLTIGLSVVSMVLAVIFGFIGAIGRLSRFAAVRWIATVYVEVVRITIPPFTNYFITLIQDSALLSVLGVVELEQTTGSFADPLLDPNKKLFIYILGALIYLAICFPLSLLARYLEARMAVAY